MSRLTSAFTNSTCTYGLIPSSHWNQPAHINETKAAAARAKANYEYGDSVAYRNMCRYNSGFLALHPLLQNLTYYWRAEPNIRFQCDIDFDPFKYMREHKKKYAFVASMHENMNTVKTLWTTVKGYALIFFL